MNKGVFWGVFYALLAFSALLVVSAAIRDFLYERAASAAIQQMVHDAKSSSDRMRKEQMRRQSLQRRQQWQDRRARTLAADQQCVSGTVVIVRPAFAEQLLVNGRIVRCDGRLAEIPLR